MKVVVFDVQGFIINGKFSPKEMCINNGHQMVHFILKPPKKFFLLTPEEKKQVQWLENNHFNLRYSDGFVSYEEVGNILGKYLNDVDLVYVKGHQKYDFLINELSDKVCVINVENYECPFPNFEKKHPMCMSHKGKGPRMCSMTNC